MSTARAWYWSFWRLRASRAPVLTSARTLSRFASLILAAIEVLVRALRDVGREVVGVGGRDELSQRVPGRLTSQGVIREAPQAETTPFWRVRSSGSVARAAHDRTRPDKRPLV